jgi:hypothetical protein
MKSGKQTVKTSRFFLLILIVSITNNIFAQKNVISVFGIQGSAYINERITPKEAMQEAIIDAKKNALMKAGIGEYLKSSQLLISSSVDNKKSADFINSEVQSQMEGEILSFVVLDTITNVVGKQIQYIVTIDAKIIKYQVKPDPNFNVNILGIKNVYNRNDLLYFSVISSVDSYLNLFTWTDEEVSLVYPNSREDQILLKAGQTYLFPSKSNNYIMSTENKEYEESKLVFIFTKSPMKFIQFNSNGISKPETVISWINAIPLDQRKKVNIPILIQ